MFYSHYAETKLRLSPKRFFFSPSLQFERSLGPGWWLKYWANSHVAVGAVLSGIRGTTRESVQCCAASEISLMWRWPCSGLQDRTPQMGVCVSPVLSMWLRLCLLSPGEAFWEFSAVRGRRKKALVCLPQFTFTWRMKFDSIKLQVFLNSLHSGHTCEQTDKMRFPLCSGDFPPPVHFEVCEKCSTVCSMCFVPCRWWFPLNWSWYLCLGTSFCSGATREVSLSQWEGQKGDCSPCCADLWLFESAVHSVLYGSSWDVGTWPWPPAWSLKEQEGMAADGGFQLQDQLMVHGWDVKEIRSQSRICMICMSVNKASIWELEDLGV